ncbi:MAG: ATP-binding cassette domain-containing protein, partial [Brachybacterium sp.]
MIRTLHALGTPSNRRTLTLLMVLITLSSITLAIGMAIIALFLDALFSGGPQQAAPWAVWAALVVVLYAAIEWPTEVLAQSLGRDYILRIHELLARRTIELPLGYFDVDRSGQIGVTATGGALFAANAPAMMVRPLMHGAVSSGMAGVFLVALDWRIGLLTIALSAVVWYRYTRLMAQYRTASRERDEHTEDTAAQVLEFAQVQPVLRAAGPDSLGERAIRRSIREQLTMLHHEQGTQQMVLRELSTIVTLGTVVIDGVATVLLLNQQLTAGTYIGIVVLVFILAKVALAGIPYGEGLQTATNTLEQVQEILDATCLSEPETPAAPEGHAIEFDGVDFGYEPGTPVVSGVSFRVEPGTTTALVGPSGSGKSTLLKLAARFYDVDAGSVRLGGQDVRDLGTRTVLGSLAMVFQDVYLFEDTLYENIRLG